MGEEWYSIKMRASQKSGISSAEATAQKSGISDAEKAMGQKNGISGRERHISGAEKIVRRERLEPVVNQLVERAANHAKGEADFINLKIEKVSEEEVTYLDALPVSTCQVDTASQGREMLQRLMAESGIERADEILEKMKDTYGMRGAMLLDVDTLERLEPDQERGIRATYMDAADEEGDRSRKNHFKEALVLATKVANADHVVGELCISDDPDYVTGYFASKKLGYVRITKLKEMGCPHGGRIFLFRGTKEDAASCIHYLEHQKVLVRMHKDEAQTAVMAESANMTNDSSVVNDSSSKGRCGKWERYEKALSSRREQHLYRHMTVLEGPQTTAVQVEGRKQHLFSSNAYLDLCNDPQVKASAAEALAEYGVGSSGSRLTTGTGPLHRELEETIARFKGREAALVYNTGYMANVGILSALAGKGDIIYSDELNHASIIDGCRLSRADLVIYRHNDRKDLEEKIKAHPGRQGVIVSDGVFSMDGDIVDLPGLVELANRYGLLSMIDEAHATGVLGETGRGTEEYYHMEGAVDVLMGTLSKAVGSEGGFVCGSRTLIDYLINTSRSFIFSTALSPAVMAASRRGIEVIEEQPERVQRLQENVRYFCQALARRGITAASETAIIPVIVGEEEKAMAVMERLKERGYYISAIRYPTVARGSARLRIALMSSHTREELDGLAEALAECLEEETSH